MPSTLAPESCNREARYWWWAWPPLAQVVRAECAVRYAWSCGVRWRCYLLPAWDACWASRSSQQTNAFNATELTPRHSASHHNAG